VTDEAKKLYSALNDPEFLKEVDQRVSEEAANFLFRN